jgi:peptide deformylase
MLNIKEKFAEKLHNQNLQLHIIPDQILYQKSESVSTFDNDIKNLISDMKIFMQEYDGVGLAAVQIGILKRIITIMPNDDNFIAMINPKIIEQSEALLEYEEGCLSVPEIYYILSRPEKITVEYQDENGIKKTLQADGILARIIQHEIDHLNGIVFINHLSMLKQKIVEKKFKKIAEKWYKNE